MKAIGVVAKEFASLVLLLGLWVVALDDDTNLATVLHSTRVTDCKWKMCFWGAKRRLVHLLLTLNT